MAKKGSNLTGVVVLLFILLIGTIGGFGYWNYTLHKSKIKSYYADHTAAFTASSEDVFQDIPDLSISIAVDTGEKVYVMFTCTATISAVSAITVMRFIVKIDATQITESQVIVGYTGVLGITNIQYSVALQYLDDSLTAGSHTITIMTMRECDGNIMNSNLFIQVY
jgi:hypothetical protein